MLHFWEDWQKIQYSQNYYHPFSNIFFVGFALRGFVLCGRWSTENSKFLEPISLIFTTSFSWTPLYDRLSKPGWPTLRDIFFFVKSKLPLTPYFSLTLSKRLRLLSHQFLHGVRSIASNTIASWHCSILGLEKKCIPHFPQQLFLGIANDCFSKPGIHHHRPINYPRYLSPRKKWIATHALYHPHALKTPSIAFPIFFCIK